jgi:phosphoglycerate kinase
VKKRSVRDLDIRGKRVLVRADFNVPLREGPSGQPDVADDTRILGALPTIQYLIDEGAIVIACSHMGRPEGHADAGLSLAPVAQRMGRLLSRPVQLAPDCVGAAATAAAAQLGAGQVLLLENLRFHSGEEANDPGFAAQLAALADLYVNDAFGAAHRAHASTEGVAHLLPSAAGLLMERELDALSSVFDEKAGKRAIVSGGAKVSSKLALLQSVVQHASVVCIGGAMANTFLLAQGTPVGTSLAEPEMADQATAIAAEAKRRGCALLLPVDAVIAESPDSDPRARPIDLSEGGVPDGWSIFDVGPRTIEHFAAALQNVDTVVWNGPLGMFERTPFAGGTRAIAEVIASLDARTIVAGGETVQAAREAGVADRMSHISTGGGAALELLEGRELPGVAVLPTVLLEEILPEQD